MRGKQRRTSRSRKVFAGLGCLILLLALGAVLAVVLPEIRRRAVARVLDRFIGRRERAAPVSRLWTGYAADPDGHAIVPNCSCAGFRFGEEPLPETPVSFDAGAMGAAGDGYLNSTPALQEAIAEARRAGGGVVSVPAGTHRVTKILEIRGSGTVLRGAGADRTVLLFEKPLSALRPPGPEWSSRGGLIWIVPREGLVIETSKLATARAVEPAAAGARAIRVAPGETSAFTSRIGRTVMLNWRGDLSLAHAMFGHPSAEGIAWHEWPYVGPRGRMLWEWPDEIAAVEGDIVRLKKPLRFAVRPEWELILDPQWHCAEGVGIEHLTIRFPPHERPGHMQDPGFNAIFMHGAMHSWVRDVVIENADNGIILERSSNVTVTRVAFRGGSMHHATSFRYCSHDNLVEDFRIEAPVHHGISTQDLSSGNVWRRGVMLHGTFDCHRGMPFDSIRTDITIANDGRPGGADEGGPFMGRRMVHWNVRVMPSGKKQIQRAEWVASPETMTMGALVGIQGVELHNTDKPWAMPPGDKGTAVECAGGVPAPPDLYEAELRLRLGPDR